MTTVTTMAAAVAPPELKAELAQVKEHFGDLAAASILYQEAAESAQNAGKMNDAAQWGLKAAECRNKLQQPQPLPPKPRPKRTYAPKLTSSECVELLKDCYQQMTTGKVESIRQFCVANCPNRLQKFYRIWSDSGMEELYRQKNRPPVDDPAVNKLLDQFEHQYNTPKKRKKTPNETTAVSLPSVAALPGKKDHVEESPIAAAQQPSATAQDPRAMAQDSRATEPVVGTNQPSNLLVTNLFEDDEQLATKKGKKYAPKLTSGEWVLILKDCYQKLLTQDVDSVRQFCDQYCSQRGRTFAAIWRDSGLRDYVKLKIPVDEDIVKNCIQRFVEKFDAPKERQKRRRSNKNKRQRFVDVRQREIEDLFHEQLSGYKDKKGYPPDLSILHSLQQKIEERCKQMTMLREYQKRMAAVKRHGDETPLSPSLYTQEMKHAAQVESLEREVIHLEEDLDLLTKHRESFPSFYWELYSPESGKPTSCGKTLEAFGRLFNYNKSRKMKVDDFRDAFAEAMGAISRQDFDSRLAQLHRELADKNRQLSEMRAIGELSEQQDDVEHEELREEDYEMD